MLKRNSIMYLALIGILTISMPVWAADLPVRNTALSTEEPLPSASKMARKELQTLLDKGIESLATELVQSGTFYPFAMMLGHDGDMRLIGIPAGLREASPNAVVLALVEKSVALAAEKRMKAVAFFMDYVGTRQDTGMTQAGIRAELNHQLPDAISVFVPYFITTDKKLRLLTPQFKPGVNKVFATQREGSSKSP